MTTLLIRADSSQRMGSGHVMRMLTLAEELRADARVLFAARPLAGNWTDRIAAAGFETIVLAAPTDDGPLDPLADAREVLAALDARGIVLDGAIVDHYALDARWEEPLRAQAGVLLAVDDLADRPHACDLLLDSSPQDAARYATLVPHDCQLLAGPAYALVRREFLARRQMARTIPARPARAAISFGGSDPSEETLKALAAFELLGDLLPLDCIAGRHFPHLGRIRQQAAVRPAIHLYEDAPDMAEILSRADLFVGAGGGTTWERCCLGLPAVVISVAANQEGIAQALADLAAHRYLGRSQDVSVEDLAKVLQTILVDQPLRERMSRASLALVDGNGASRVRSELLRRLRPRA